MRKTLRKIKCFVTIFLIILIMGLFAGLIEEKFTLSDISVGIMILSPFALLSTYVIVKDIDFDIDEDIEYQK